MRQTIVLCGFVVAGCPAWRGALASVPAAPTEIRIIDSYSQVGIDTPNPRFGWVVNDSDRSDYQSAYQIIVATNATDLDNDIGDVWDSGKVITNQQYGVVYAGSPLQKTSQYWWKVRTWDKDNQASPWSSGTNFVTAFFQPGDWDPRTLWIRNPQDTSGHTNNNPPAIFRKEFQIGKPVKQAFLFITGLGQFVASLNGAKIGDHELDPDWTDYDKTVCYVTFDVTTQIQAGNNVLGVMLGNGWFANSDYTTRDFGPMKLWGQLHIDFTDGTSTNIVTDVSWKTTLSPFTMTELHGSENYDARLEQPGWNAPGFDASSWNDAVVATPPIGALVAQSAPPTIVRQVYQPVKITNPASNVYVYDFGQNMNAQYEITVSGTAGMTVYMLPGEYLTSSGRPAAPGNNSNRTGGSYYTLKGGGKETWRLSFSATGFRYLECRYVTTNSQNLSLPCVQQVKAYRLSSAARDVGSFHASDERYNQIYKLALRTLENNLCSVHTDGPNLERQPWQEVVWTTPPSTVYQHDLQTLLAKITRDIRDAQRTDGLCPDRAPNYYHQSTDPPGNQFDDAPAWGASAFITPWIVYTTYGDIKILDETYTTMTNYLAYLKSKETNGLVTYGLGDWMAPAGSPVPNVAGAVYVYDTRLMRDIAAVLGKTNDAIYYGSEFRRVRDAYNNAYFNTNTQSYLPMNQANQAIPLAFGIVPSNSIAAVRQALVDDIASPQETGTPTSYGGVGEFGPVLAYHVTTGDIGTTLLWRALGDAGQNDLVQRMVMQSNGPSYMNMIYSGETTIAEDWYLPKTRSHDHDMYAGIFEWLFRSLGGISALKPGYEQFQLKPGIPSGLTNLACTYDSVRGIINSSWSVNTNENITWNVQVPVNTTAKVFIPVPGTSTNKLTIRESGMLIWTNNKSFGNVTGVTFDHVEPGFVVWNVGSGAYQFEWRITPAPTGLSATSSTNQVILSWLPVMGATGYVLKRSASPFGPYTNIASNLMTTNYADSSVSDGVTYYYAVSALFPDNESANSAPVSAATVTSLDANILLYQDSFSRGSPGTQAALSNTAPDIVNLPNGKWKALNSFSTDGTKANYVNAQATSALIVSLPVTRLLPGLSYKVSADLIPTSTSDATTWMGISFCSAYDNSSVFTNLAAFLLARKSSMGETFYGSPGLNNGSGDFAGTGGSNNFAITLSLGTAGETMVAFSTNGRNFRSGSLTSNQVAMIQAIDVADNGNGSVDNLEYFVSPPAAPGNLTALADDKLVVLNWPASFGSVGYKLKRSTTNGGPYGILLTNPSTGFTNTGLNNGTRYYYVVSALGDPGESEDSLPASTLSVTAIVPFLSGDVSNSQLQLLWPIVNLGWLLQSQTSSSGVGLGTNWVAAANSDSQTKGRFPLPRTVAALFSTRLSMI